MLQNYDEQKNAERDSHNQKQASSQKSTERTWVKEKNNNRLSFPYHSRDRKNAGIFRNFSTIKCDSVKPNPVNRKLQMKYHPLCDELNYSFINIRLLIEALTRQSAIEEHIAGAASRSYQRLEFVGDRVLRYVLGYTLWEKHPTATEGELTEQLKPLVSNKGILPLIAWKLQLDRYLISV